MDWTPIVSAGVGGSIGILSTLAVTVLAHRREDRIRWDDERLRAICDVVSTGSQLIGWHYRRGKALSTHDISAELLEPRERVCNEGLDQLHAAIFRASLLTPELGSRFKALLAAEKGLRVVADDGLSKTDEDYICSKDAMELAIESIEDASTKILKTRIVKLPVGLLRDAEAEYTGAGSG